MFFYALFLQYIANQTIGLGFHQPLSQCMHQVRSTDQVFHAPYWKYDADLKFAN